ncbi:hypothetical protein ACQJ0Y_24025, partial [Peribacillus simplex]|uniref:hypothetical protein n=1 Tax=Peribacillus simplex TaxID=1478 RepID=UPI003CF59658
MKNRIKTKMIKILSGTRETRLTVQVVNIGLLFPIFIGVKIPISIGYSVKLAGIIPAFFFSLRR